MRTISVYLDNDHAIRSIDAITYLTHWAWDSYDMVSIYADGAKGDLIANYMNSETKRKYTIGAIYNKQTGKFSFHS